MGLIRHGYLPATAVHQKTLVCLYLWGVHCRRTTNSWCEEHALQENHVGQQLRRLCMRACGELVLARKKKGFKVELTEEEEKCLRDGLRCLRTMKKKSKIEPSKNKIK